MNRMLASFVVALAALITLGTWAQAQIAPTPGEIETYTGLHAAVIGGSTAEIERLVRDGTDVNARDGLGRTPLMVAAHRRDVAVARALIELGANVNALDHQSYDVLTIAAVLDDVEMLQLAIAGGANTRAVTGPFGGTALSAAARAGRAAAVKVLIAARAPVDHVDLLGSTALVDAIEHGDGGPSYVETVKALVAAGADVKHSDHEGGTALALARARNFAEIVRVLEQAELKR